MLLDLLLPNRCLHCNLIIAGGDVVCEACKQHINFTHWNFNGNHLLKQKCQLLFPTENAFALMAFEKEGLSRSIIHSLKYKGRENIADHIAQWTTEHLDFQDSKPELLVSVPLHPKKQKERGYNQLHRYIELLSAHYDIPYHHTLLKRNQYKKAQALKNKIQRSQTEQLFSLTEPIQNTHCLLIDDVFTTGNTLNAAAWELLKDRSNKVSILVMAVDM